VIKIYFSEPEEVIYNFLRARVDEVTRTGLSNRMTADTQNFSGNASDTEFTLTEQPECIVSVVVDGVTQIPYTAYNIDLDNKKIKFATAPASGTDNIVVSFKKGSNWIYPDLPRVDLSKNNFPRIGSWQISKTSGFEEVGDQSNTYDTVVFQIDVLSYKDLLCEVSGESFSGPDVTRYLARQVENAFKDYAKTDLIGVLYDFQILDNSPAPYQSPLNIFQRIMQIRFNMRNFRRLP